MLTDMPLYVLVIMRRRSYRAVVLSGKTSEHGSGARSCFMGLASLFCIRRAAVLESLANQWQRITSHLLKLAALRRVWSAIGQHLAEVKRRGRIEESILSSSIQDGDNS